MRLLIQTFSVVFFFLAVIGLAVSPHARAQTVIASTSFEEPTTGGQYTDTGDPSIDHDLVNNPGEAPVDYIATGGELGFDSRYVNTRDGVGLTDGDFVGVSDFTGAVGAYTDGSQGFQISDADGKMVTEFDAVELTGTTAPYVALDIFIQDTGYESNDVLRIYATDGTTEIDLVNLSDADLEGRGTWEFVQADLSSFIGSSVTLVAEMDCNSSSEAVYFDNIQFSSDGPLPVELSAFDAVASGRFVTLTWATLSETNNAGFDILHNAPQATSWATLGFVEGAGTVTEEQAYRFQTGDLSDGTHRFRLRQVDVDGTPTLTDIRTVTIRSGQILQVSGPNPVTAGQTLAVSIRVDKSQRVDLELYNVLGQRVRSIQSGVAGPEGMKATVSTTGLASGVYFLRLRGDNVSDVRKLTVIR